MLKTRSCLALMLIAWPAMASASLGGTVSSIESDRVHVQGALLHIVTGASYTVHELQSASGTVIREFVSPAGTVFGVAWQGPWMPDLRQLLGTYFDQYVNAVRDVRARRRGHGPIVIDTAELVVRVSGRQRAFSGNAYVPSLLPAGFDPQSVR